MFKVFKKEIELNGKKLSLETGKIARQADGAIIAKCGETVVLATVVGAKKINPDIDYFPLSVNYQEKYYAAGKIPGGYFKREARPTESETLISRLIDRPIRPLFPDEFKNEVQLLPTVISYDKENEADILSIIASSAALAISGMPFMGPIAASRVGFIDGKYILNPSKVDLEKSKDNLINKIGRKVNNQELASYLMYPKVFLEFIENQTKHGDLSILSTPLFFYGPEVDKEYSLAIDKGKSLILRYLTTSDINKEGKRTVFFELNGQPRSIDLFDNNANYYVKKRKKVSGSNINKIGSPLPGQITQIVVKPKDKVLKGDKLIVIEAMKMETIVYSEKSGTVSNLEVKIGDTVETKDLLLEIE